jgi:hypothetical protein
VAVSTKGLQISRIIVPTVTVYVVYVELAAMCRNKAAMQAGILFMYCIWILVLLYVSFIDSLTAKATSGS